MALEDSKIVRKAFKTEKEIHIALGFLLGCLISALITYIEANGRWLKLPFKDCGKFISTLLHVGLRIQRRLPLLFIPGMEAGKLTKLIWWLHRRMSGMSKWLFCARWLKVQADLKVSF